MDTKEIKMAENNKAKTAQPKTSSCWKWFWTILTILIIFFIGVLVGNWCTSCKCVKKQVMTPSERILYSYHNRADMVAPIEKPVVVAPAKVAPAPVPAPVVSKPIVKPTPSVRKTYSNVKKHAAPAPKPVVKPVTYVIEEITETYQPCHTAPTAVIVEKYRF